MRILGLDPGKNTDPFGAVLIEADRTSILVKGCTQWKNVPYPVVEEKINHYFNEMKIDKIIVESNSMGDHVIDSLRRNYNLPVAKVFTGAHKLKTTPGVMDKIDMTMWMNRLIQNATEGKTPYMKIVESESEMMKELNRQWAVFGEYHKNKFEAPSGGHDDLVMAMMVACYYARYNKLTVFDGIITESMKYKPLGKNDFKTVLPSGSIPLTDYHQSWHVPRNG